MLFIFIYWWHFLSIKLLNRPFINWLQIIQKPQNLKEIEAASIPYTALTAWSALKISGDLAISDPKTKKVLVLGASGGVGTAAVQLLKAWGCQVSS